MQCVRQVGMTKTHLEICIMHILNALNLLTDVVMKGLGE